jgi:hypothetical protein
VKIAVSRSFQATRLAPTLRFFCREKFHWSPPMEPIFPLAGRSLFLSITESQRSAESSATAAGTPPMAAYVYRGRSDIPFRPHQYR